nr:MAG TPA: Ash protein family protein [Caudoviricetes sp.]
MVIYNPQIMRHSEYAPTKSGAGIGLLLTTKAHTPRERFFCMRNTATPFQWWAVRRHLTVRRVLCSR